MSTTDNSYLKNILQLNLGVFLISTSGVLGRSVPLSAAATIGWRALLAICFLFIFLKWKKFSFHIAKKDRLTLFIGGALLGLHWVTYFKALQLSNVAIGMLTLYAYPTFTSLLEPLILKSRFQKTHLYLGILVLIGIGFLVPDLDLENKYTQAIGFGLFSALCYTLRNIIMKKKVATYQGSVLMWYQMVIVGTLLLPISLGVSSEELQASWKHILILGLLTTSVGHTLFLMSFKHFNITTASIMSSVQPIYGIIMGILILGEKPDFRTIIGGLLIISAVIIESLRVAKANKAITTSS